MRNNRFPLDLTSWEQCLHCENRVGAANNRIAEGGMVGDTKSLSNLETPPIIIQEYELGPNWPTRLQATITAIKYQNLIENNDI